ncbi:MAG: hypothetical protein VKO21_04700 [Candidatus Sericytochromatia bacterium]|nr:hypothetical protein [Candidatus Sericytochromatia bacterium]
MGAILGLAEGQPALAGVVTFTGTDRHLYLNEAGVPPATASLRAGWLAKDGVRASGDNLRGVSELRGDLFVSVGPFRISEDRFITLLQSANVAKSFTESQRPAVRADLVTYGLATLAAVALLGGGAFGATTFDPTTRLVGYSIASLGVAGLGLTLPGMLIPSRPPIAWDEAYEAILEYNRKLDAPSGKR